MLERAGHEVTTVTDGDGALDALAADRHDVALFDINMPGIGGIEAAKLHRFAALDVGPTPIVAVTADATPETAELCREAGMAACLVKPIDLEQLLRTVGAVARSPAADADAPAAPRVPLPDPLLPVVDDASYGMIASLGDADFLERLMADLARDGSAALAAIDAAARAGDERRFREALHALRSCIGNLGAARLHAFCASLGQAGLADFARSRAERTAGLAAEFAALREELERRIRGAAGDRRADDGGRGPRNARAAFR
jgi:two-component system sensor histidine kinase RpfC